MIDILFLIIKKKQTKKPNKQKINQQSSNVFIWYEHVSIRISIIWMSLLCNQNNSLTPEWSVINTSGLPALRGVHQFLQVHVIQHLSLGGLGLDKSALTSHEWRSWRFGRLAHDESVRHYLGNWGPSSFNPLIKIKYTICEKITI